MNHLKVFLIEFIISCCVFGLAKGEGCVPIPGAEEILSRAKMIVTEYKVANITKITQVEETQTVQHFPEDVPCTNDGTFPNGKDCKRYSLCYKGRRFNYNCEDGEYYNEKTLACDKASNVKCTKNL